MTKTTETSETDEVEAAPGDTISLDFSQTGRCLVRIDCGEYGMIEAWGSPGDGVSLTLGTKVPNIEYIKSDK